MTQNVVMILSLLAGRGLSPWGCILPVEQEVSREAKASHHSRYYGTSALKPNSDNLISSSLLRT